MRRMYFSKREIRITRKSGEAVVAIRLGFIKGGLRMERYQRHVVDHHPDLGHKLIADCVFTVLARRSAPDSSPRALLRLLMRKPITVTA